MNANNKLVRVAWSAMAAALLSLSASAMAAPRHGAIAALEPIENKNTDVPEKTKTITKAAASLGGLAGGFLGIKSSVGAGTGQLAGSAAGEAVGAKIAGTGSAAHYMVKIRFDDKSQVVVSKPSAEVAGLAVGSRVIVNGTGESMQIAAE